MVGVSAERLPFQRVVAEFERTIAQEGLIRAELLRDGLLTSSKITFLPQGTIIFEHHAPHLGFPPYFSTGPDGTFLDSEKTRPAGTELGALLEMHRVYDPRLIAQTLISEEYYPEGGIGIDYDLERFPGWSLEFKKGLKDTYSGETTSYYTTTIDRRLLDLTFDNDGEALTLRFLYPDQRADMPNQVFPEIKIPNFFETIHEAAKIVFSSKEELQKRPKKP